MANAQSDGYKCGVPGCTFRRFEIESAEQATTSEHTPNPANAVSQHAKGCYAAYLMKQAGLGAALRIQRPKYESQAGAAAYGNKNEWKDCCPFCTANASTAGLMSLSDLCYHMTEHGIVFVDKKPLRVPVGFSWKPTAARNPSGNTPGHNNTASATTGRGTGTPNRSRSPATSGPAYRQAPRGTPPPGSATSSPAGSIASSISRASSLGSIAGRLSRPASSTPLKGEPRPPINSFGDYTSYTGSELEAIGRDLSHRRDAAYGLQADSRRDMKYKAAVLKNVTDAQTRLGAEFARRTNNAEQNRGRPR